MLYEAPVTVQRPTFELPTSGPTEGEVSLKGTGTPDTEVAIVVDGEVVDTVTVGEDGTWTLTIPLALGDHTLSAQVVDAQGEVIEESESITYIRQKVAPVAPVITMPEQNADLSGGSVPLKGTGEPGTEIEIVADGTIVGTATVGEDGTWATTVDLEPGEHSLVAQNAGDPDSQGETITANVPQPEGQPGAEDTDSSICIGDPPYGIDRGDTYVVARCEYMALIAVRTGVMLCDLIEVNPQVPDPHLIYPDQVLNLPPR